MPVVPTRSARRKWLVRGLRGRKQKSLHAQALADLGARKSVVTPGQPLGRQNMPYPKENEEEKQLLW